MTAISIGEDLDLDIADERDESRYLDFHEGVLPVQEAARDDGTRVSPHDPLLPAVLAVPMLARGLARRQAHARRPRRGARGDDALGCGSPLRREPHDRDHHGARVRACRAARDLRDAGVPGAAGGAVRDTCHRRVARPVDAHEHHAPAHEPGGPAVALREVRARRSPRWWRSRWLECGERRRVAGRSSSSGRWRSREPSTWSPIRSCTTGGPSMRAVTTSSAARRR